MFPRGLENHLPTWSSIWADAYSKLKKEAKYTGDKKDFLQKRQKRNKNAEKQKNEKLSGQNATVRRKRKIMDLEVFDDE